jgi:hypothetical protein
MFGDYDEIVFLKLESPQTLSFWNPATPVVFRCILL